MGKFYFFLCQILTDKPLRQHLLSRDRRCDPKVEVVSQHGKFLCIDSIQSSECHLHSALKLV